MRVGVTTPVHPHNTQIGLIVTQSGESGLGKKGPAKRTGLTIALVLKIPNQSPKNQRRYPDNQR